MTRTEYHQARRLIRDNGRYALRWLPQAVRAEMDHLLFNIQDGKDRLAERADIVAYCRREGIACNVHHTR
ncbi:MAG: hypothetical protein JO200_08495 [Comamonas sp.]|nr:hypothetical protein [Comamonas sp.]